MYTHKAINIPKGPKCANPISYEWKLAPAYFIGARSLRAGSPHPSGTIPQISVCTFSLYRLPASSMRTKRGHFVSQPLTLARWWNGCIDNSSWLLAWESIQPHISADPINAHTNILRYAYLCTTFNGRAIKKEWKEYAFRSTPMLFNSIVTRFRPLIRTAVRQKSRNLQGLSHRH